jgi:competence protein ComEA
MPTQPGSSPPHQQWPQWFLCRADQAAAAMLLALSLSAMGGWWVWQGRLAGRIIDIDSAQPIAIETKIDVNQAHWPELALMPNVGEKLAKAIVADRSANGPFRDLGDLRRVRGIGPRTLEGMKPYLLPLPDLETTAEGKVGKESPPTVN